MDKEKNLPRKNVPKRAFGMIKRLIRRVRDDDVPALGAEHAYHLLLAMFPFLIFLAALLTYAPGTTEEVLEGLSSLVPAQALKVVRATLNEIAFADRSNMISLGMIFTIWAASAGFAALARGFNKAYDVEETRGFLRMRALWLLFVPLVSLGIVIEAALVVFGNVLLCGAPGAECRSPAANALLHALRLFFPLLTMTLIFSLLYAVIPNKRQTFVQVLPGAAFASIAWTLASFGFSFYVDRFANYARYYGSLGGVMILLVWLYLSSVVLLVGSEINAELLKSKDKKDGPRRK